jgi:anti-sigma regulatory factor (Ser/Thr protein kinase)
MHSYITDFLTDIVENAAEAGSGNTRVTVFQDESTIEVTVADTGRGMTEAEISRAYDPFASSGKKHSPRNIHLGIPFLAQAAAWTLGDLVIRSRPGEGTTVSFRFNLNHPDTPPLGDISETFRQILTLPGDYDMLISRTKGGASYRVSRAEVMDALGELSSAGSQGLLSAYLESLEKNEGDVYGKTDIG